MIPYQLDGFLTLVGLTDEVLVHEVAFPFGRHNASLRHMLSLAATYNLLGFPWEHLPTYFLSWYPPLVAASD